MAAGRTYQLEIMTPQKYAYKGEVESIIAEASDGSFGVLINHAPMLSALRFGILRVREVGAAEKIFTVSEGFFEINANKAALLVDTCETKEEIDVARARAAKERAEKRLAQTEGVDISRAKAALIRAIMRLKATGQN
jgi:F-type H+-transporting ATPase subunit epsilon